MKLCPIHGETTIGGMCWSCHDDRQKVRAKQYSQKNPDQPMEFDELGTLRFKRNKIVEYLLDTHKEGLNELATKGFSDDDWVQFNQLIGYSVSGFLDLQVAQIPEVRKRIEKQEKEMIE